MVFYEANVFFFFEEWCGFNKSRFLTYQDGPGRLGSVLPEHTVPSYLEEEEVYLVTALVPSETACLANSPGRSRRTAVWTSLEEMV